LPVYLLKRCGANIIVITNASGGINPIYRPGDIMAVADHINLMGVNPLIGPHHPFWGPRFPDMSGVYDSALRSALDAVAQRLLVELHHGTYLATSGPLFETPAETAAFRKLGADAVGMSTVPEATLAHVTGMRVVGISCIANMAAGVGEVRLSHSNVVAAMKSAIPKMKKLLREFWMEMSSDPLLGVSHAKSK
jgi:purine-nucleoside phosphorylase